MPTAGMLAVSGGSALEVLGIGGIAVSVMLARVAEVIWFRAESFCPTPGVVEVTPDGFTAEVPSYSIHPYLIPVVLFGGLGVGLAAVISAHPVRAVGFGLEFVVVSWFLGGILALLSRRTAQTVQLRGRVFEVSGRRVNVHDPSKVAVVSSRGRSTIRVVGPGAVVAISGDRATLDSIATGLRSLLALEGSEGDVPDGLRRLAQQSPPSELDASAAFRGPPNMSD